MSAYSRAYRALTSTEALRPEEAAGLLADLRRETGADLADAVERQLSGTGVRTESDSDGSYRRKQRAFAASMRVVNAIRRLAAARIQPAEDDAQPRPAQSPFSPSNFPNQRNRSTT